MLRSQSILLFEAEPSAQVLARSGAHVFLATAIPAAVSFARKNELDAIVASIFIPDGQCFALRMALDLSRSTVDTPMVGACGSGDDLVLEVADALWLWRRERRDPDEFRVSAWTGGLRADREPQSFAAVPRLSVVGPSVEHSSKRGAAR